MKIETRIRQIAAKKVRVEITSRKRAQHGFTVNGPNEIATHHMTKKEALNSLLARVRCSNEFDWSIVPAKPNQNYAPEGSAWTNRARRGKK